MEMRVNKKVKKRRKVKKKQNSTINSKFYV